MSSYWRVAGLNYLKYLQVCNATVRNALKEPVRTAAETRGAIHFREQAVVQGKRGPRSIVEDYNQKPYAAGTQGA